MKNEFVTVIRPDLVWYDDNVNWLKHLVSSNGTEQKFFLKAMTEKKDLTMLTVDRLPGIDQTFDCWVILAFDSSELQKCKITSIIRDLGNNIFISADLNLMDQILSHFNEKCQGIDYNRKNRASQIQQLIVNSTCKLVQ